MQLLDAIKQRHSVKEYDSNVKIPREQLAEMLLLAQKAPSSINLQPWRFVVLDNPTDKAKIDGLVLANQTQLTTSSAIILALADLKHPQYADKIFSQNVAEGMMTTELKDHYVALVNHWQHIAGEQGVRAQAIMDTNLAVMQFLLIAKEYGYDTNPMGGFERDKVLKALNIDASRYVPVMLVSIGKGVKAPHLSSRLALDYTVSWGDGLGFKSL